MDYRELVSKHSPFAKMNWLPLSLGILGMIFFVYGLIGLFSSDKAASNQVVFEASSAKSDSSEAKTILVDMEGAVVKSGVYKLPDNSRVQDGLVAAGGLSAQADRKYIAKNLNLAIKLSDGVKIYIPSLGEAVKGESVLNTSM
jgi:DNA uptake protein ComE-like DNA-binding protein